MLICASAASLAAAHYLVWRRRWGGTVTRVLLWVSTGLAPLLWWRALLLG